MFNKNNEDDNQTVYRDKDNRWLDKLDYTEDKVTRFDAQPKRWGALVGALIAFVAGAILVPFLAKVLQSAGVLTIANLKLLGPFGKTYLSFVQFTNNIIFGTWLWQLTRLYSWVLIGIASLIGMAVFEVRAAPRRKVLGAQNQIPKNDDDSILYDDELVEELASKFQIIADRGMKSKSVSATGVISHAYLSNKGLNMIQMAKHDKFGRVIKNDKGQIEYEMVYPIDEEAALDVMSDGGTDLKGKDILIDAREVVYKYKVKRDKNGKPIRDKDQKLVREPVTLAEFINEDWYMPDYEVERPLGFYIIEGGAVNSLIIASTRANKTQLLTLNTIDVWRREKELQSMIVNDPKGEMLLKSHLQLLRAGSDVMSLNLIDPDQSIRFNPLQVVIYSIRHGDITNAGTYLDNLMAVFFQSNSSDSFWSDSARAVGKMTTWLLIIDHLLQEREMRIMYRRHKYNQSVGRQELNETIQLDNLLKNPPKYSMPIRTQAELDNKLDKLWGEVTMAGIYQMLSLLSRLAVDGVWQEDGPVLDSKSGDLEVSKMIKLFRTVISNLPEDAFVRQFNGEETMLSQVSSSEKTEGTIYGVASTSLKFFSEPVIKRLTTVSPNQGLSMFDFSFQRRFDLQLNADYVRRYHLRGSFVRVELFKDPTFKHSYQIYEDDKRGRKPSKQDEFMQDAVKIDSEGWIAFSPSGIVPRPEFYMQITIQGANGPLDTFYFKATKQRRVQSDGVRLVRTPYTNELVWDGVTLVELDKSKMPMSFEDYKQLRDSQKELKRGQIAKLPHSYERSSVFKIRVADGDKEAASVMAEQQTKVVTRDVFDAFDVAWSERPKALFLVTPPNIETYTRLPLIMVDMAFNLSVSQSYLRRESQKPDLETHFMLEEFGNLTSDGEGLSNLSGKLSIGLGQGQKLTLVLQGPAQIDKIYGKEMWSIIMDNVGVTQFIASPSKETVDYVSNLTGTKTIVRQSGMSVKENVATPVGKYDSDFSTSYQTEQVPLVSPERLRRLTNGETLAAAQLHRFDNTNLNMRPNAILNTKRTSLPFQWTLHKLQKKQTNLFHAGAMGTFRSIYNTLDTNPDEMIISQSRLLHMVRTRTRIAIYYQENREKLEGMFEDKDHPINSNELANAINEYMMFDADVNRYLLGNNFIRAGLFTDEELEKAKELGWVDDEQIANARGDK